jgi:hypothetical protein
MMRSSGNKWQYLFSIKCLYINIIALISKRNTKQNFSKKIHNKLSLDFDHKQQSCACGEMTIHQNSCLGHRFTANFPNLFIFRINMPKMKSACIWHSIIEITSTAKTSWLRIINILNNMEFYINLKEESKRKFRHSGMCTQCQLTNSYRRFGEVCCLHPHGLLHPEDVGTMLIQIINKALHSSRLEYSSTPLSEHQVLQNKRHS